MTRRQGKPIRLSSGGALPTEFRLFVKGVNTTEKGDFIFDDVAARSVMNAYREWGVDVAIDLEHQMLDDTNADPTARDARGWCKLELRPDGSLWATQVSWTPDGAERLTQKRQRYVSPAFEIDPKTKRVLKLVNIALVAVPATHKTPALIAASARGKRAVDPELVKEALDVVASGDQNAVLDILKRMVASAADAVTEPDDEAASAVRVDDPTVGGDEDGSEGSGEEGVAPPKRRKLTAQQLRICGAFGISAATFLAAQRSFNRPLAMK